MCRTALIDRAIYRRLSSKLSHITDGLADLLNQLGICSLLKAIVELFDQRLGTGMMAGDLCLAL